MTRDQIFRQTSVDLLFCPFLLSISRQLEKKIFRQKSYGMDLSFLSSELLNSYISGQGTIPAKLLSIFFLLVIFFWTDEHFPTKEYSDKSLNVVFLTYLNRWIRQGIKFPDKSLHCFPSSGRFFLLILNSWTANFPTKKNSDKSLNVVFLPTIFFWTDIYFPTRDKNLPTKVYTVFLLPTVSMHYKASQFKFRQAWQFSHSAFRSLKMFKISKLPGASPPGPPLYQGHSTTSGPTRSSFLDSGPLNLV